jgi:FtsP/CotA-like multicopper oxidase with cupredoxin domain
MGRMGRYKERKDVQLPAVAADADSGPASAASPELNRGTHNAALDRRSFLNRGALGVAGAALLGKGLVSPTGSIAAPTSNLEEAERKAAATAGGARAWGDRPRGWWRHQREVIHPPADHAVQYREIELDIRIVKHEVVPGYSFHVLAFNGQVPGPEIRVQEGEWVKVYFTNKTELLHTIHWHGVDLQYEHDGVPYVTQAPVMPNTTFEYKFQAIPGGTRFYHCHFGTLLHMQHAMHGALIIEPEKDPVKEEFGYTRDYTLVFSTFDTNAARDDMNFMLERMKQRMWLMKEGALDAKTLAVFENRAALFKAIEEGWDPPYLPNRNQKRAAAQLDYNFFAINGLSYPLTEPLMIKRGETIRVRLVNGGGLEHYMHLHGHQFWKVAEDGNLLGAPLQMNTVAISPGKTVDLIIEGYNPGYWTFHDHDTSRVTNNGMYPGGMLTVLVYEEMADYDGYRPKIALDE